MNATGQPYSKTVGLTGLEAYALDAAVIRWGSAFQAAIQESTQDAKTNAEAEHKANSTIRRWIPSMRKYR